MIRTRERLKMSPFLKHKGCQGEKNYPDIDSYAIHIRYDSSLADLERLGTTQ